MRLRAIAVALLGLVTASPDGAAVETYSTSPFRKLIAQAVIADRPEDAALYLTVVSGTFWSNENDKTARGNGIYYQIAGVVDITVDGKTKTMWPREGIFIEAGAKYTLKSKVSQGSPTYLHFLLSPGRGPQPETRDEMDGAEVELFRSAIPVPGLARERNLVNLIRVPVPPESPPDPPHQRKGAALHYVLSGVGSEIVDGRGSLRGPGSVSFEPAGLAYQWSNPGPQSLVYLLFNVNPKGAESVIGLDPRPNDLFSADRHAATLAIYCIVISMFLMLLVSAQTVADHYEDIKERTRRAKRWWRK